MATLPTHVLTLASRDIQHQFIFHTYSLHLIPLFLFAAPPFSFLCLFNCIFNYTLHLCLAFVVHSWCNDNGSYSTCSCYHSISKHKKIASQILSFVSLQMYVEERTNFIILKRFMFTIINLLFQNQQIGVKFFLIQR